MTNYRIDGGIMCCHDGYQDQRGARDHAPIFQIHGRLRTLFRAQHIRPKDARRITTAGW
jgi:hypothetical protein